MNTIKEDLHSLIDEIEDMDILGHVYELLKATRHDSKLDFWDKLTNDEKKRIEESIELSKNPQNWVPHDQVMEKASQWGKSK
ncbi:MAG: hypothetical protein SFW35_01820 [Chitinophagales bacterium]|nr:hypothetical protein [Chitinophagales bacterium]